VFLHINKNYQNEQGAWCRLFKIKTSRIEGQDDDKGRNWKKPCKPDVENKPSIMGWCGREGDKLSILITKLSIAIVYYFKRSTEGLAQSTLILIHTQLTNVLSSLLCSVVWISFYFYRNVLLCLKY
jgi:hypothetical protein